MLDICVTTMTKIYRNMAKGKPKLNMASGSPTIPPPTHVLRIARTPSLIDNPWSPAIIEYLELRISLAICMSESDAIPLPTWAVFAARN